MGFKGRGVHVRGILLLCLCVYGAHAWGASVTPEDEYEKLIRVDQSVQPLGDGPFGAQIGLYDGSLSFEQTDVSLPGDGPALTLTRSFHLGANQDPQARAYNALGDWQLSLPRIATLTADQQNVHGWLVDSTGDGTNRCSHFNAPPIISSPSGDGGRAPWWPDTWWMGYHLIIPGQGSQDLLQNGASDAPTYPAVTKNHWRISCLAQTANGQPGEGFVATAPDGTRYWFNELIYRPAPMLTRPIGSGPLTRARPSRRAPGWLDALRHRLRPDRLLALLTGSSPAAADAPVPVPQVPVQDFLIRRTAWMLVTHIEDRFGNSLDFCYNAGGHLTGIQASDGRALSVQYVSGTARIHSVTLQPASGPEVCGNSSPSVTQQSASGQARTWTYAYAQPYNDGRYTLTMVTRPDGSRWTFNLQALDNAYAQSAPGSTCNTVEGAVGNTASGIITHPSGLQGTFQVTTTKRGRSHVPRDCLGPMAGNPDSPGTYAAEPKAWYTEAITQKTFSGAGMPDETWHFNYSAANDSWASDCTNGCPGTVYTDVVAPDGSTIRRTFSNKYDVSESHLLTTVHYSGAEGVSTFLGSEVHTYAAPESGPWPQPVGYNLQGRINSAQTTQRSPLDTRVIHQQGDSYTWQAEAFNSYAQVTKEKRFNSIAGQHAMETQTTYRNDTSLWVLGLPLTVKNLTTGDTVEAYTYDTSNDTLQSRSHFGQKAFDYTWTNAGELASFTDANGHTTHLSGYTRGIPTAIGYADGTSQSLAVDAFGDIIAITDQAGHTTSYSYDAIGRLTRIDYPQDGSVAWNPTTFTNTFVTSPERGLAANHWRRTVATGNARHVTYFDAQLRPLLADTYIAGQSGSHGNVRRTYDWRGLTTFQSVAVGGTPSLGSITSGVHTTHDALGRVTEVTQDSELGALTTTTAYLSGARTQVTDPRGHVTTRTYQVFDQPAYDSVIKVQAPEGITQTISRDVYGHARTITQSGAYKGQNQSLTRTRIYDAQQRLCRSISPESGSTVRSYDAAGNLAWSAAGQSISGSGCGQNQVPTAARTTRTYDAMNRVTQVTTPAGSDNLNYTYDADGRLLTAGTTQMGAHNYYNARGLLTARLIGIDGHFWTLHHTYDANGHLASLTYPDGRVVSYAPDALGRPTKAGSNANAISYFPDGSVQSYTLGNGITELTQRNTRQLPSNRTYALGNTLLMSNDYSYDANANLTHITDLVNGHDTASLSYDALNRLTTGNATSAWGTRSYAYDALNNLRRRVKNGHINDYDIDATNRVETTRVDSSPLTTYQYDARGNRSAQTYQGNGAVTHFTFDVRNQLIAIPGLAEYVYDANGRRIKKVRTGQAPQYDVYSSAGKLLFNYDAGRNVSTDYVYLGGTLIARHGGPTSVRYLLTDRLGTPRKAVSPSDQITASFAYAPYGRQIEGPSQTQPNFTGHVHDAESNFTYMLARYYEPTGRFLSVDPVGPTPGDIFNFNRYAYANDNPIVNTDPTGTTCQSTKGGGYNCHVDQNSGKFTKGQLSKVNKAYTNAVNHLMAHPDTKVAITVDGHTATASAGAVAKVLIGARVATKASLPGNTERASTLGGGLTRGYGEHGHPVTTIDSYALGHNRFNGTKNIGHDLSATFVHEGLHGLPGDRVMLPLYQSDPKKFGNDHQLPYDAASDYLYDFKD